MVKELGTEFTCDSCPKTIVSQKFPLGWFVVELRAGWEKGRPVYSESMEICDSCFPSTLDRDRPKRQWVLVKLLHKLKGRYK